MAMGAKVEYSDPYVLKFPKIRRAAWDMSSVDLKPEVIANYDCVLVATNHDDFDYAQILKHAKLIVDTRGVYREPADHVVKA